MARFIINYKVMFTVSNEDIVWKHILQSRRELYSYLEKLPDQQWDSQSLCQGWKVRDVVAHLILIHRYNVRNSWVEVLFSGFNINRFIKKTATTLGKKSSSRLLELFHQRLDDKQHVASISSLNVLIDLLVHEQDIRIPLGDTKLIDTAKLELIFGAWQPDEFNYGEKLIGLEPRVKGLKFVITDLKIKKGQGSEVIGTAQDILLAITGRSAALDRLDGPGVNILKADN